MMVMITAMTPSLKASMRLVPMGSTSLSDSAIERVTFIYYHYLQRGSARSVPQRLRPAAEGWRRTREYDTSISARMGTRVEARRLVGPCLRWWLAVVSGRWQEWESRAAGLGCRDAQER